MAGAFRVGADLEPEGSVLPQEERYFLSPAERAWRTGSPTLRWVLKEAAWKLLRPSPATPFHALEVRWKGGDSGEAALGGRTVPVSIAVLRPWPGWVGAVMWCPAGEAGQ